MQAKPKRHHAIETTVLPDGHIVLVSKKTNWAFTLTPAAALVWEFCDGTNTTQEILENVRSIPEITGNLFLKEQIDGLLAELDEAGLFEEES